MHQPGETDFGTVEPVLDIGKQRRGFAVDEVASGEAKRLEVVALRRFDQPAETFQQRCIGAFVAVELEHPTGSGERLQTVALLREIAVERMRVEFGGREQRPPRRVVRRVDQHDPPYETG